jgi:SWI/SNF related-matrix-associated actin-dependent regulator of chromatin subfamily C
MTSEVKRTSPKRASKKSRLLSEEPEPQMDVPADVKSHPLERDPSKGMNPKNVLTGYYGVRGERIRHVVHEGALRLPKEALELIESTTDSEESKKRKYKLPHMDSVIRPSRDQAFDRIQITDVEGVVQSIPEDPLTMRPAGTIVKTVAANRFLQISKPGLAIAVDHIRGGGGEEQNPTFKASPLTQNILKSSGGAQSQLLENLEQMQSSNTTAPISHADTSHNDIRDASAGSTTELKPPPTLSAPFPAVTQSTDDLKLPPQHEPTVEPVVVPLDMKPEAQWEQLIPGPNDEMQIDKANRTPKPAWFQVDTVSELEKTALPEWFNNTAPHRTAETFVQTRNRIMEMYEKLGNRYVTTTMVRRAIPGDAGSLMRLQSFLTAYSIINEDAQNESAPTPVSLQEPKNKYIWGEHLRHEVLYAVVEQARKKPKQENIDGDANVEPIIIDWEKVAETVGHGVDPKDCEKQFLAMPVPAESSEERSITPDNTAPAETSGPDGREKIEMREQVYQEIVDKSNPDVITAATTAALANTPAEPSRLAEAQKAALAGLLASTALIEARSREDAMAHVLSEIVELRMQKLENRLALLDEMEGMCEAERVALELERRDLYTTRCRHWFGGP